MMRFITGSLMGRLVLIFVGIALIPIALVGYLSYTNARTALEQAEFRKLDTIRDTQVRDVRAYVREAVNQVRVTLKRLNVVKGFEYLASSYEKEKGKPSPTSGTSQDSSGVPTAVREALTAETSIVMEKLLATVFEVSGPEQGYEDFLLIDPVDGRVLYSYKKFSDWGQNLRTGALKESALRRVWENAVKHKKAAMVDFSWYQPIKAPAAFIALPVFSAKENKMVGVLVLRLSPKKLSEMMQVVHEAGKTAEAHLVGHDLLMLSDSRFQTESSILKQKVDNDAAKLAVQDNSGDMVTKNYRGNLVFASYGPVALNDIEDLVTDFRWGMVIDIDVNEAIEPALSLGYHNMVIAGGIAIVVALIGFLLARAIARPIMGLAQRVARVSDGDLTVEISAQSRTDEIGSLADSLRRMMESLRSQTRKTLEGVNTLSTVAFEISAIVSQLSMVTSKTSSAVTETVTTVEEVKQSAKVANEKAKKVAEDAQEAVQISQAGRKATEDTIHGMNVIRDQMESVSETVIRLSEHSQAIEDIISTVQDIADQSNLLAVNASIEAARAGDQGKGFAVVAHEIKTLAGQSRQATEQVRTLLTDVRNWIGAVVMATEQSGMAVDAGVSQSVAAGGSILSLGESVSRSAQAALVIDASSNQQFVGVAQVAASMINIEEAIRQNVAGTAQLESAVKKLTDVGGTLKQLVERYRV